MSNFSSTDEDDESLSDILSEKNDLFYDAPVLFESDIYTLNKKLECELNLEETHHSSDLYQDTQYLLFKEKQLRNFDFSSTKNKQALIRFAKTKYGLLNNRFRKRAWPLLILDRKHVHKPLKPLVDVLLYRDHRQVELDAVRTCKRFPPQISENLREILQNKLIEHTCTILMDHSEFHYYQGYHEVCLIFLLTIGINDCIPLIAQITQTHFKPFLENTMETSMKFLSYMMPLINEMNSAVAYRINESGLGVLFAISWLITWYSHVIEDFQIVLRLFDLFIVTDPMMPVYLAAVIVCERSNEVLSVETEMASLFKFLSDCAKEINDLEKLEELIEKALELLNKYPSSMLPKLNEKWKERCKLNESQQQQQQQFNNNTRRKLKKNSNNSVGGGDRRLIRSTRNYGFIIGLTIAFASAAFYAYSTPKNANPDLLLNKFYQILYP